MGAATDPFTRPGPQAIGYGTHILIGVDSQGIMTVLVHWHYTPRQHEVEAMIRSAQGSYVRFILATPCSLMPGNR